MMHPLGISAGQAGLQADIVVSVQGIGERLDAELEGVDTADLDAVRSLARRVSAAHAGAGGRADGWRTTALGLLAAREAALLVDSREESAINQDTTTIHAPSSVGSKAEYRARLKREGYKGRRW